LGIVTNQQPVTATGDRKNKKALLKRKEAKGFLGFYISHKKIFLKGKIKCNSSPVAV